MGESKVLTAAYVPFKTFMTSLDHLNGHGVPNFIDRSVFPSFSGMTQGQVIGALLFLGLISEKGEPTETLHKLVEDKDNRKATLKAILQQKYSNLFAADLTRVTPSQFDSLFSTEIYGAGGDTRKKARTFLFQAFDYTGIPYSKLLTQRMRAPRKKAPTNNNEGAKAEKNGGGTNASTPQPITPLTSPAAPSSEPIKTVTLAESGKLVWIGTNANVLELKKGADRDFMLALTDLFDDYEEATRIKSEDTNEEV